MWRVSEGESEAIVLSVGEFRVEFRVTFDDDRRVAISVKRLSDAPADGLQARLPLRILPGQPLNVSGKDYLPPEVEIDETSQDPLTVAHQKWRVQASGGSRILYPVKPFNPYHKEGLAEPESYRAMLVLPLTEVRQYDVAVEVRM